MRASSGDEDDGLARFQRADAVQHFQLEQRPALFGFHGDLGQGLFGHAGVMLQEHPRHVVAVIEVADIADKTHHRADADIGSVHRVDFDAGVKRRGLYTDGHAQPPVTGGKKATSSPASSGSSTLHIS